MKIEQLDEAESDGEDRRSRKKVVVRVDAKRALVGAGARVLFYPTLLYNVLRNKIQAEFRWWDEVDQFLLLGAVPFPKDVPRLKQLGVGGVITLNEPYETLVPTSLYHANEIEHLVIPTRDYLFAPSSKDINRAVDFIHKNTCGGRTTYVHCKAGRGRSTTIVLCYLVKYRHMTPSTAFEYVRSRRPRVLLASSQWKVLITKADLEGYYGTSDDSQKDLSIGLRSLRARPMIARLSCLLSSLRVGGSSSPLQVYWLRCVLAKLKFGSCSLINSL
ncbi:hypothetical protein Syun_011408 [Stephania yunnanensis]|uniref:phosphatidylglycerophosphatase n=1 Tax=Stephania yunnanensis TaxID=152371 RepID=A0AAP0JYQ3_9MAGN